ncbi:MAG TPA: hypothetical protein VJ935_08855 [Acidimicrobiia bacterium]|nr:hypothetical protein [Acidimicrobiia bacterium]
MVPPMPPDLRRKLRAAYPVFGISDLAIRWIAPGALLVAIVIRSWPLAIGAIIAAIAAWFVRGRQLQSIVTGESIAAETRRASVDFGGVGSPPGPEYMRSYYETWPLLHKSYGHPMVVEAVEVWCPEHNQWESGEIEAMVSPGAFMAAINLSVEFDYGTHSWKLGDAMSFIPRGKADHGGRSGELYEVRSRQSVDKNVYDGYTHDVAVSALFLVDNSWGLVTKHLDSLGRWEGLDKMIADMPVVVPGGPASLDRTSEKPEGKEDRKGDS